MVSSAFSYSTLDVKLKGQAAFCFFLPPGTNCTFILDPKALEIPKINSLHMAARETSSFGAINWGRIRRMGEHVEVADDLS